MSVQQIYDDEEDEVIEDYGPYVDLAMRWIPEGADRVVIENEIRENVDYYRLKIKDAVRRTVRLHGGNAKAIIGDIMYDHLKDADNPEERYNVSAIVTHATVEEYWKNGESKKKTVAIIVDDTDVKRIVIWGNCELNIGGTYAFKNCSFSTTYDNLMTYPNEVIDITPPKNNSGRANTGRDVQ